MTTTSEHFEIAMTLFKEKTSTEDEVFLISLNCLKRKRQGFS
jgi:hypothetical protein